MNCGEFSKDSFIYHGELPTFSMIFQMMDSLVLMVITSQATQEKALM